jgi:hypothetical protein
MDVRRSGLEVRPERRKVPEDNKGDSSPRKAAALE